MHSDQPQPRIAVWLDGVDLYNRDIIHGVADYVRRRGLSWQLYLRSDFSDSLPTLLEWQGEGIIADFSDLSTAEALRAHPARQVGVCAHRMYAGALPCVALDNAELVGRALSHLIDNGWPNFAMFSQPNAEETGWALEREQAFSKLVPWDSAFPRVYRGLSARSERGATSLSGLVEWIASLPKPVGIVAVNDARARLILQACQLGGFEISADVGVIGIDNDPLLRELSGVCLTSVIQGTYEMGQGAARLLHDSLRGIPCSGHLVPSTGINVAASCTPARRYHPYITRALHYICRNAQRGIKGDQVADYVGISRSWLDIHFKREVGHSVHDEILSYKIREAKRLLEEGAADMSAVAADSGFSSVQYLYSVFARELGCTPRDWRDRHLGEAAQAA